MSLLTGIWNWLTTPAEADLPLMTKEGKRDYERALDEIAAQRDLKESPYADVYRLHCKNGYVDFRVTASTPDAANQVAHHFHLSESQLNGYQTGWATIDLLHWLHSRRIDVYDTH